MRRYLLTRVVWAVVLIVAIVVINFILIHLAPGDPINALIGDFPAPPSYVAQLRRAFGLNQPLPSQLWLYLVNLAHGNLGFSFANRQPVLPLVLHRAMYSLALIVPALLTSAVLGVLIGTAAARHMHKPIDGIVTGASLSGYSVPVFWLGQLLILLFAVRLGWLPAQGATSLATSPEGAAAVLDFLRHLALPWFCVTLYYMAINARVSRSSVVDVQDEDFVATARAKGLQERAVLWRHILPNALVPVFTVISYNFGYALTGAILTETVFGWPGIGTLFLNSITNRDYPVLEGIFLLTAVSVVVVNLVTDLIYVRLDPRIKIGGDVRA